jgi:hypothetical protein
MAASLLLAPFTTTEKEVHGSSPSGSYWIWMTSAADW